MKNKTVKVSKAVRLSDANIKAFNYDKKSGKTIQRKWDVIAPGLGIEVFPSGRKSWIYRYRINRKQKFTTLGAVNNLSLVDARLKVAELAAFITEGIDPKKPQNSDAHSGSETHLNTLFDKYISRKAFDAKSKDFQDNFKSTYKNHLKPTLGERSLDSIKRVDIRQIIDDLIEAGSEGAARGVLSRARILFSYALQYDYLENSPADHIKPDYTTTGKSDKWLKTDDELLAAWNVDCNIQTRALVRLMLACGFRRGEAHALKWTDIQDGVIRLNKTKNGKAFEMPVMPLMQSILDEMKNEFDSEYIFPSPVDHKRPIPRGSIHIQIARHGFTPHVLRHTVKSHLAGLGVDLEGRNVVLNHSQGGMDDIYQHDQQLDLKRTCLTVWHTKIKKLLNPGISLVI